MPAPRRLAALRLAPALPLACALALAALACALAGCANTVQERPIPHNLLEGLIEAPFPVYWLGRSFHGLAVSEAKRDPSHAYTVQYGGCSEGGEGGCVPPLRLVTSPDNSFLPGGQAPVRARRVRGVRALLAQGGRTLIIATGPVVLDIYARNAATAAAAAATAVPINAVSWPHAPLPPALPNTGFATTPLPSQVPSPLRELR
ncbi:MAG TPA: hypothetical protein VL979_00375 [Solirubrobacteraceae bacterium]|nr:hypothetical protein [Solirubrobacteraceae bacterium]